MDIESIRLLYDYHIWATNQILLTVGKISQGQFTAPYMEDQRSIRSTLVHLLSAEWIWRSRCQEGISPGAMLLEEEFLTLESIKIRWEQEQSAMLRFLAGLDDQALKQAVHYQRTDGSNQENILWHLLMQVINHGTQHRSEVALMLTAYHQSPGDMDLIVFLRRRKE